MENKVERKKNKNKTQTNSSDRKYGSTRVDSQPTTSQMGFYFGRIQTPYHKLRSQFNTFKKKVSLRQKLVFSITSRQKKIIDASIKKNGLFFRQSQSPKLKSAQRMMTTFHKQLKRIKKKNILAKKFDEENKDCVVEYFEAYSANLKGSKNMENKNYFKVKDGFYVVCGGHGSNGKDVAKFVGDTLIQKCKNRRNEGKFDKNSITKCFTDTAKQLQLSGLDIAFSGATCVLTVCIEKQVIVANIGDCGAMIKNQFKPQMLSTIHRPSNEDEKERVQMAGGVVSQEEVGKGKFSGPLRIWAPGKKLSGPGFTVSRSFGIKAAIRSGVICQPDIETTFMSFQQDFIVLGTDALFDSLDPTQILTYIQHRPHNDAETRQKVCDELAQQVQKICQNQYKDIAIMMIFS